MYSEATIEEVDELVPEIRAWRRDIHANAELSLLEKRTASVVAQRLREFGCDEVHPQFGVTGVVGVIKGKLSGNGRIATVAFRADMDALAMDEDGHVPWTSRNKGVMHACGHDGHTAMLLGAAQHLAKTRNFAGKVVLIFQPAEESMEGARAMIKQGLMDRFGIEEVYGIHNWPGVPVGTFAIRSGPFMAATGSFNIKIEGRGAHASRPHEAIDTVLVGAQLIVAAQQIVARNLDPFQAGLISITEFHAGSSPGVIPQTALLRGSMRGVDPQVRKFVEERLRDVIAGIERMTGAKIELDIRGDYPATVNHPEQTRHAIDAAKDIVGEENVVEAPQVMAGEDFAYMLLERPGCYLFVGNGSGAQLHHPGYDFNDEAIRYGTTFWIKLAERSLNDRGAS